MLLYGSYDCCGDFVKTVGCNGNHDDLIMFHRDILRKTDIDQTSQKKTHQNQHTAT